ncbi:MAG: glycosyltransferase family 39 protein [Deferribacteres bacterium]|nr:glycosyltransferase family 39 protein [candidate division KSB1 bacterium]MCB9501246.1 glycosyltransferase family 39 protein [Deferribacteres bacterium]
MRITTRYFFITLFFFFVLRLLAFSVSYDVFSDAFQRIQLMQSILEMPVALLKNVPIGQYGIAHIFFGGFGLWIWNNPLLTPRLISLIMGLLTFFPFLILSKEYFSRRVAYLSAFLLSFYTLHVKMSVVTANQSTFILLVVTAIAFLIKYANDTQIKYLVYSGISIGFAALVRYEGIFLIPLLPFLWLDEPGDTKDFLDFRSHLFQATVIQVGTAFLPISLWSLTNYLLNGHLWPGFNLHFSSNFLHNQIFSTNWSVFLLSTLPGILFTTMTPPVFLGALWGILRIFKNGKYRALFLVNFLFLIVVSLFCNGTLLENSVLFSVLLTPYAAYGFYSIYQRFINQKAFRGIILISITSFAWILTILFLERAPQSILTEQLSSVSPIAYLRTEFKELVSFFNHEAADAQSILLDVDQNTALQPLMLYANEDGREIISTFEILKDTTNSNNEKVVLDKLFTNSTFEYIVSRRESKLDKELEKLAENQEFSTHLKVRLVLSNRYFRIYKTENLHRAGLSRKETKSP